MNGLIILAISIGCALLVYGTIMCFKNKLFFAGSYSAMLTLITVSIVIKWIFSIITIW